MIKERLEEIKTSTWNICECETCYCENFKPQMIAVDPKHFEWLIEQAERVQELEEDCEYLSHHYGLEAEQNKRYREALEFYANKINHLTFIENGKSNIEHDQGEKARKALEGEE